VLDKHQNITKPDLEAILAADHRARSLAVEVIKEWF
jgi:1-deoxy-D-xylulose-5-phosphate reductoisomerase